MITSVCSWCADRLPSRVRIVQPSGSCTGSEIRTDHRLDRQHQAFGQHVRLPPIVAVGDRGPLVNRAADAVTGQPVDHHKALTPYFGIDRPTDFVDAHARTRNTQGRVERRGRAGGESMREIPARIDDNAPRRVGDVAVLLHGDIELHEVTSLKLSRPRHAMDDFVVQANQHGSRKAVHECRCRPCSLISEHSGRNVVELAGGDARTHVGFERVERQSGYPSNFRETFPIRLRVDGHVRLPQFDAPARTLDNRDEGGTGTLRDMKIEPQLRQHLLHAIRIRVFRTKRDERGARRRRRGWMRRVPPVDEERTIPSAIIVRGLVYRH